MASSTSHTAGATAEIDNSTTKYLDIAVTVKMTAGAAPTAGEIRLHFVGKLDDTNYLDTIDATDDVDTFTDANVYDAVPKMAASTATDTSASQVYFLGPVSLRAVFGGTCPEKCVVFITHSMVQALASSGNQVTIKGSYENVAQS